MRVRGPTIDHQSVVARYAWRRNLVEAHRLHDGRERENGKGKQHEGDARKDGSRFAATHVGDTQVEGRQRDGHASDVRAVHAGHLLVHLLELLLELTRDHSSSAASKEA